MRVQEFFAPDLGNTSYLVVAEEEPLALVVDSFRDVDLYLREAERLGVRIVYALETHTHNDFLSGSRELQVRAGVEVVASAASGLLFPHRGVRDGDTLRMGEVEVSVLATPGHTPEHIAYLVTDTRRGNGPHALFSGGALLVGGVARSDLLGQQLAPFLARWFFRTMERLRALPDEVAVYPTHGGGSYCLATPQGGASRTTTIGQERLRNPFFQARTEAEFLDLALSDLPPYPTYYRWMAGLNRQGPRILGGLPRLAPLPSEEVKRRLDWEGAVALDLRPPGEFARGHIPGAYAIPYSEGFAAWVGWLVPFQSPLLFVLPDPSLEEAVVRPLVRIGYDRLEGFLEGGMEAWGRAGLPVAETPTLSLEEAERALREGEALFPLDVRFPHEWRTGHIPGALHIPLGSLPEQAAGLPRDRVYLPVCAQGYRSVTAVSLLERAGLSAHLLLGGMEHWKARGFPLER